MIESQKITTKCDNCETTNDVALNYFLGENYKFSKYVIGVCRTCHKNFIAIMNADHLN